MLRKEYTDLRGFKRRVGVLNSTDDPSEGIPLDVFLDLDELYSDVPETFRVALYNRLWDMGLIEATDFLAANAANRVKTALQLTLKSAATDIVRFITSINLESNQNGTSHKRHA